MNRFVLVALVLFRSLASAATIASTDISPADVSVRFGGQDSFKFLRGETATEADRDAMQHAQLLHAMTLARYAKTLPGCAAAVGGVREALVVVMTRLGGTDYEGKNCRVKPGSGYKPCDWLVPNQGRFYSKFFAAAEELASCLSTAAANGQSKDPNAPTCSATVPPELLDLVDLRIEGGRCGRFCDENSGKNIGRICTTDGVCGQGGTCVGSKTVRTQDPKAPYDEEKAAAGPVSTRTKIPDLVKGSPDVGLLHGTHNAHQAVTNFFCHNGPSPEPGGVAKAHKAYEEACGDDASCRHFRQLKRFPGDMDNQWTGQQQCWWRAMEDFFHVKWMDAQERAETEKKSPFTRWIDARLDGDDMHFKAHLCATFRDQAKGCDTSTSPASGCFLVRPACDNDISKCGSMSCVAWLNQFMGQHPELKPLPVEGRPF